MSLVKITFDGSGVSAKQDADINHHLTGLKAAGIIKGLGDEISYTVANNYITFSSGYVQIYGRRIYVEPQTKVYVSLDSSKKGYVVITVDLSNNSAVLETTEITGSLWPILIQQDLCNGGTIYQFPICKYSKTTTAINIDTSFAREEIETPKSIADSGYQRAKQYIKDNYKFRLLIPENKGNNMYQYDFSGVELTRSIVFLSFNGGSFITLPGGYITNHSIASHELRYIGTDYSITVEYLPGRIVLISTGSSMIRLEYIYYFQYGEY